MNICPKFVAENPTLLLDGDGTILDFTSGYASYLSSVHGIYPVKDVPSKFDFSDMYPHFKQPYQHIPSFTSDVNHMRSIKAYSEAPAIINSLACAGVTVKVITSIGMDEGTISGRKQAIQRDFGDSISSVEFLSLGESKEEYLASQESALFVDDLLKECISALKTGHKSFIFNQKYNQNLVLNDGISRIDSLSKLPYFKP